MSESPGVRFVFEAIGTAWTIEIFEIGDTDSEQLQRDILARIDDFDKNYSRFRDDSLVTRMSREAGRYTLPEDAGPLLDMYEQLYRITGGAVTPLIGQTLADAGYDASYSFKSGAVSTPPKWEDVLDYDFPHLTLKQPALLDFGAAGKGYLADLIGGLLESRGLRSYYIDGGGDILYKTDSNDSDGALEVALEHPADPSMAIGIAKIRDQSLCGSSGNRRTWNAGDYHHILDPRTLSSPRHIAALWAVADTGLLADGLATALFFVPPDKLAGVFEFEYAVVLEDLSLVHSPDFPAEFFTNASVSSRETLG